LTEAMMVHEDEVLVLIYPTFRQDLEWTIRHLDKGKGAPIEKVEEVLFQDRVYPEPVRKGIRELLDLGLAFKPHPGRIQLLEGVNS